MLRSNDLVVYCGLDETVAPRNHAGGRQMPHFCLFSPLILGLSADFSGTLTMRANANPSELAG